MRKPRDILLVDNQPIILEFFEHLLVHEGFTVNTASDGLAALRLLENRTPDVVVSDLVMPNIDGSHLCRVLRGSPRFKNTYIVILSAIAAEERIDLRAIGANACIAKGPLTSMKRHLMSILNSPRLDARKVDRDNILGIDEIFQRSITAELLVTKRHGEVILENLHEGILELSEDGEIIFANPSAQEILHITEQSILGKRFDMMPFRMNGSSGVLAHLASSAPSTEVHAFYEDRELSVRLITTRDPAHRVRVVILNDITARATAERQTRQSLEEKEVLLKEVHHRVKNNLAMVASLVSLQSRFLHDEHDVEVLDQLRNRIQSISLIHQQLYMSEDVAHIDFAKYAADLSDNLMKSFVPAGRRIEIATEIVAPMFPINTAISLGLIVAELLVNAFKYAFPNRKRGAITLSLHRKGSTYRLSVADDGVGLPAEVNIAKPKTLGFQLVVSLATQLQGKVRSARGRGTTIVVEFSA